MRNESPARSGDGRVRAAFACVLLALSSSGCVLAEPADQYPFMPTLELDDTDGGENNENNGADMPPALPPRLIFTEILIDAPGSDPSLTERGEYIEIKNIGDGPADPRNITMFLNDLDDPLVGSRIQVAAAFTTEEREVVDALQIMQPGDYFVWVRHEDPSVAAITEAVAEGYVYDYGRYANGPTLPHEAASRRRLTVGYRYPSGDTELFDILEWEGHDLIETLPEPDPTTKPITFSEGQAVAVDDNWETMSGTDDPQNWCVPTERVGDVFGTPGRTTMCP